MLFQYFKGHLHTIPGNRPKVLDECRPTSSLIESREIASSPISFKSAARRGSRWKVQHRDQACARLNGCNRSIPRITQHEHYVFLKSLF